MGVVGKGEQIILLMSQPQKDVKMSKINHRITNEGKNYKCEKSKPNSKIYYEFMDGQLQKSNCFPTLNSGQMQM